MSKPIISIIIPVYNTLLYLPRCIYSIVLLQNCTDKIEVILVDDGSTDGVEQYIDVVAEKYSFIRAIHFEENVGCSKCRNTGLLEANGEYVFFCDSDDQFAPHALDKMIEHAFEYRPDIMLVKLNTTTDRSYPKSMFTETNPDADIYSKITRTLGPWKLWYRKFLLDNRLEFPNAWPDDSLFALEAHLLAKKVSIFTDQDYYFLETRPEGIHDSDAGLNKQSVLLYNSAFGHLAIYKQYADQEKGKRYMLPRILLTVAKCFCLLLLNNDPDKVQKEKWIFHIKELFLSICNDREYLRTYESANIYDYISMSALMDYQNFDKAKVLALKLHNEEWKEEKSDEEGCIYSLGSFKFDARYFFEYAIDIKDIEYNGLDELVISGNVLLKNFQPEIIYGSKVFLKAADGDAHDKIDFQMDPVQKSSGYSFKARINMRTFEEGIERLGLQEKRWRWDILISIGGLKSTKLRIDINDRPDLFTYFADFIEANEKYALIPHVSSSGILCFWHFGKETKSATKDFLRKLKNRPMVNELAVNIIAKKDFASLRRLSNDIRTNKTNLKIVTGRSGVIYYNGNKFNVGKYAYIEASVYSVHCSTPRKFIAPFTQITGFIRRVRNVLRNIFLQIFS